MTVLLRALHPSMTGFNDVIKISEAVLQHFKGTCKIQFLIAKINFYLWSNASSLNLNFN